MPYSDEIASALEGRIREAEEDLVRMRGALATLSDAEATPVERPKRSRAQTKRKRTSNGLVPEAVLTALRLGHADQATTLAKELDADPNAVRKLLHELYEAGQVARTGERAATRWSVPDEAEEAVRRR